MTGTVTYQDEPVQGAIVAFRGDEAPRPATGVTNASGRFRLTTYEDGDGAVPGRHVVTVTKYAGQGPDTSDTSMEAHEDPVNATSEPESEIPERYADPVRSGLEETVTAGQTNDFRIELTD